MDYLLPSLPTLLVLRALENGPLHGYRIARWIEQQSTGILQMKEGTLYPLLHQLERKAYIAGSWQKVESERPTKTYSLTNEGIRYLNSERREWNIRAEVVRHVLFGEGVTHGLA